MRTVCDVCEGAAAAIFCAAEEAALCAQCDEKVHTCNKLASRHIRVKLAEPSAIGRCDICENSPAFFFCVVDGSSLCLECDVIVHVGSKRSHERYLLLRQKIELLGDKLPGDFRDLMLQREDKSDDKAEHNSSSLVYEKRMVEQISENLGRCRVPPISISQLHSNSDRLDIDLNARPNRIQEKGQQFQAKYVI